MAQAGEIPADPVEVIVEGVPEPDEEDILADEEPLEGEGEGEEVPVAEGEAAEEIVEPEAEGEAAEGIVEPVAEDEAAEGIVEPEAEDEAAEDIFEPEVPVLAEEVPAIVEEVIPPTVINKPVISAEEQEKLQ